MAIIITRPASVSGKTKTPTKYREFFQALFEITTNFQLVFNFEQTHTVTILFWRAWYNGSYTMMAKPIRAVE